jgi:hypothetical protein
MTADERALLLLISRTRLLQETAAALAEGVDPETHVGLIRLRELIAKVAEGARDDG